MVQLIGGKNLTGTSHDLHGKIWLVSGDSIFPQLSQPIDSSQPIDYSKYFWQNKPVMFQENHQPDGTPTNIPMNHYI